MFEEVETLFENSRWSVQLRRWRDDEGGAHTDVEVYELIGMREDDYGELVPEWEHVDHTDARLPKAVLVAIKKGLV